MGVLTPEEVRRLNAQFIDECRQELIKQGKFSRGFQVERNALMQCFKAKWKQYKIDYARRL